MLLANESKNKLKMNKAVLFKLSVVLAAFIIFSAQSFGQNSQKSDSSKSAVQKLYEDFNNPWGMTWLPDGRMAECL